MVWLAWVSSWHRVEFLGDEKVVQRILRHAKSHVSKDRYIMAFDPAVLAAMRKRGAILDTMGQSAPCKLGQSW
ncbi:MAG TPA: hypothetical protein VKH45_07820 [Candidatus Acidoferrum sp.]|nr:hypothetical protein [Candidatus Acidoferrum sp.]